MQYQFPHSIQNCTGEIITFKELVKEPGGDKLLVENFVNPNSGPPMHTHFLQDEVLTVEEGRIGYQVKGRSPQYATKGQTVFFKRGTPHRFWNAGDDVLHCTGYIQPANTIVFFLSSIFAAQNKAGKAEPEKFGGAYLLTRYSSEYDMNEIPGFVKKAVLPLVYRIGKLLGKYKHFKDAPAPVKS